MNDDSSRVMEVLLFARARELAGSARVRVTVPGDAVVRDVLDALVRAVPALEGPVRHCRLAVDQEFRELEARIPPDAEIALIPPVSGGRPLVATRPRLICDGSTHA